MKCYDLIKRAVDVALASVILIVSAPLQGAIWLLIRSNMGKPVLFRQARPGKEEELFELIKFRTMRPFDLDGAHETDAQRMTKLGGFLRSTSLDELPTLWNVLKGDMSLVGPRPLLAVYLERYSEEQRRRHDVRPGITGLAQVSGRNAISWEEKFAKDLQYVERRSLCLDARILCRTVTQVWKRRGIHAPGQATMPEFTRQNR